MLHGFSSLRSPGGLLDRSNVVFPVGYGSVVFDPFFIKRPGPHLLVHLFRAHVGNLLLTDVLVRATSHLNQKTK